MIRRIQRNIVRGWLQGNNRALRTHWRTMQGREARYANKRAYAR